MTDSPREDIDVRGRMVSGVAWRGAGSIGGQLIHLVAVAVLARILSPAEFGLAGMATILTGLVARLGDLGLGSAVIQRKRLSESQTSSVFWVVVAFGLLSWLAVVAVSPVFASFMHEPQLVAIVSVSAFAFVIASFGNTQRFLLLRDMHFRQIAVVELVAAGLYAASAVVLALMGLGVWSLVIGGLIQVAAAVVAIWVIAGWRPGFTLDLRGIRELMSFGIKAWAGGLFAYAQESGDYFVIGRALGTASLGHYTMAFNLANVPRTRLGAVVSMVSFAGLSRIQDDHDRVRRGFLRMIRYISLVSFPLLTGMLILAWEFVLVVYGSQWIPSALPLRLLSAAAIPASLSAAMPSVLLAKDQPGLHLKISIAQTGTFFALVIFGVQWGIVGVAVALVIHAFVFFFVYSHYVNGAVGSTARQLFVAVRPASVGALIMGGVVTLARLGFGEASFGTLLSLLLCVLVGAAVYVGVLYAMRVPELAEVRGMLREARRGRREASTSVESKE